MMPLTPHSRLVEQLRSVDLGPLSIVLFLVSRWKVAGTLNGGSWSLALSPTSLILKPVFLVDLRIDELTCGVQVLVNELGVSLQLLDLLALRIRWITGLSDNFVDDLIDIELGGTYTARVFWILNRGMLLSQVSLEY